MRRLSILLIIALIVLLTGCASDEYVGSSSVFVVRDTNKAEYQLFEVRRGDISLTETLRLSYLASVSESYGFGVSGLYYDSIDVSVGDSVRAGDILATLEMSAVNQEMTECQMKYDALKLSRERNLKVIELLEARENGVSGDREASERRHQYDKIVHEIEGDMEVIEVRLAELSEMRDLRVITSAIDGTVTFVRDIAGGETSVNGRTIIEVTDLSSCVFTSSTEHPEALSCDTTYIAIVDKTEYELELVTASQAGIVEPEKNEKSSRTNVYFKPLMPSPDLTSDSTGRFTVTVDSRTDVLYVSSLAVTSIDGKEAVYVLDESGLRCVRYVTVGLRTPRTVEIIDGLTEGEKVII